MKIRIFVYCVLVLLFVCASCSSSDDEVTERYVGEWMSITPGSITQEQWLVLPDEVVNFFKPDTLIFSKDSIYHAIDASNGSTTRGNDVLTIKGNMAKLDVNSTTTGLVENEIAIRKEYYLVFKSGTYNNSWQTCVVKPDGIFIEDTNERFLRLDNYRYKMGYLTERDTISSKSITVSKSFSAQSSVNKDSVLLFSRNDTTFRATKEDEGYYLEIIKPSDNGFYYHTMDRK